MPRFYGLLARSALLCLALLWAYAPIPAAAQDGKGLVIVVMDMQRILRESVAVQEMQKEIDELRVGYQAEFRKKEEALRAADQELGRQRSVLSADDFAQQRQELERNVAQTQRDIQQRRKDLETLFDQGMKRVQEALVKVVQDVAAKHGADLVLAKSTVVLVRPDLEITTDLETGQFEATFIRPVPGFAKGAQLFGRYVIDDRTIVTAITAQWQLAIPAMERRLHVS